MGKTQKTSRQRNLRKVGRKLHYRSVRGVLLEHSGKGTERNHQHSSLPPIKEEFRGSCALVCTNYKCKDQNVNVRKVRCLELRLQGSPCSHKVLPSWPIWLSLFL